MRLDLLAPAKVNLFLAVRGRRPDGYHDLRMFLAPVSLFDRLRLESSPEAGAVEVACEGDPAEPGGDGNLCARAARFYFEETGVRAGVRVGVRKHIPSGAGLGGGSSDAAVTMLGLERLFILLHGPRVWRSRRLCSRERSSTGRQSSCWMGWTKCNSTVRDLSSVWKRLPMM